MEDRTILVVDDEASIRDMLTVALEAAGFTVLVAEDAKSAHAWILDRSPDLILLDWMMPGTSGLELLRRLQRDEVTSHVPVIMLTAKTEEGSKITGLDSGADDYIIKPFSPRELISRVRAVLRRFSHVEPGEPIQVGDLHFDPVSHRVTIADLHIPLTPTEYRLLEFFLTHPERAYTRERILDYVWGSNVYIDGRTVDVHIRRLRKSIAVAGHDKYVQTVRGTGYRFSTRLTAD